MAKIKKTFIKKEETSESLTPKKQSKLRLGKKGFFALSVFVILLIVSAAFLYFWLKGDIPVTQSPQQTVVIQNKSLIESVAKLIELPNGEQPRIATVTDVTKLLNQPFFANAKNGDKVLIYETAAKVYLYRPNINKLIEVAPLNTTTVQNQAIPTPEASPQLVSAVILNGTLTSGLAKDAQNKISTSSSDITVLKVGDTVGGNYDNTIVVDISGKNQVQTEELAKLLGGKMETTVPPGESSPSADILIILGANFVK